ncbi:B3 domain-containing protein Os03g0212300-like isoform X2 [Vigna radiata var. radiata]|uniref:B3 domain-containing protein Os03g0212300-like isoform X2 n=1 Tax=Vigna radiata var. radiata TaxID=3916 RepID=A0A3Q0FBQ1_VIGRR|nr:B3 domain-containing protein Os03g0212300-like isoform X2 [Vigna radiata var. radiata]
MNNKANGVRERIQSKKEKRRTNSEREPAIFKSSKSQTTPSSPALTYIPTTRMASEYTQRNATLPISFYKVILKTNLQRLLPNGTEWKVIWEKDNGEIWLKEGWKEFVEHYSLDHGHFVFFKYEGISQIHVNICDQSGLEIDYPCLTGDGNYNLDHNEEEPILILDEEESPEDIEGEKSVQKTSSLNQPKQTRARKIACNFISCNPFFTVVIKACNAMDYRLWIPDLEGIIRKKKKCALLQRGQRSWKVKLLYKKSCFSRHCFGAGIHLFLTENELKPGDVCVFELISKKDCIFKAHVF